ncbi:MAG: FHA domain-containing protein [Anaerolineae bacterium]
MSQVVSYVIQTLQSNDAGVTITAPGAEGYVLGRIDEATDYAPDIDLSPFEARERGVSRRHCALVQYKGDLHLVDLGSINGTFINGKRIPPDSAFRVGPGDEIRLGMLNLVLLSQKT